MRTASARLLMRACARAPSAMLITSTPPSISIRAASSAGARIEPDGRVHLDRDDELAPDLGGEPALLLARDEPPTARGGDRGVGGTAAPPSASSPARRPHRARSIAALAHERGRRGGALHARGGRDAAHVLGRRAAAAADEAHAELAEAPREDAEVLGRGDVDEAIVDAPREAGVGDRRDRERRAGGASRPRRGRPAGRRSS